MILRPVVKKIEEPFDRISPMFADNHVSFQVLQRCKGLSVIESSAMSGLDSTQG
jgi:hypothetical protein